jgi:hypothetical protein
MEVGGMTEPGPTLEVGEVLDAVAGTVRQYVVMTEHQADAVALWVAHTHALDAADASPYLSITSAEKESGKTRLLEVLDLLVARPWLTGRTTAAVLPRKIDREQPTLLLDESDAAFNGDKDYAEALRGVLNTGHRRGGKTTVCVGSGGEIDFRDFSTFGAKAIAGIGRLPDTVASRSIPIRLQRRAPGEPVQRFRYREAEAAIGRLRAYLMSLPNLCSELRKAEPELPDELGDRAQDCWEPLLAIADLAGDDWSGRARRAALALSAAREVEDDSKGVQLLADIRTVLGGREEIPSTLLLDGLTALEESPWATWHKGKPLTQRGLANLLRAYGVRSEDVHVLEDGKRKTLKGYRRESLSDAFTRYLSAPSAPIRIPKLKTADSYPRQDPPVARIEEGDFPLQVWDGADGADRTPDSAEETLGAAWDRLERERAAGGSS